MTSGSPTKHIFFLALPLMFGNMFQQLYTMVDAIIVGQGVGVNALAALGAADWINWLILGVVTGFTQGFSILFAQKYGAGDEKLLRKSVGNGAVLGLMIAAIVTAASLIFAKPALQLMNTPDEIISDALSYLYIMYSGTVIVMAYNFAASLLRSLGDGRTPLVAMIIASFINIVLDLLFVMQFGWGIKGAAAATVLAQLFSFVFCFVRIRRIEILALDRQDFRIDRNLAKEMLKLGTPVALQNGIIGVGGVVVQSVINGFGIVYMAGFTATNKLYGLLEIAAIAFGYSMTTYMGQNIGAKNLDRIKKGMKSGAIMAVCVSVVISAVVIIFGKSIVGLFVQHDSENYAEVIRIAYTYLSAMGVFLSVLYLLHVYRSALQGLGDTIVPMASGIAELIMRISVILILPPIIGEWGIYFAEIAAWIGAVIILVSFYYVKIRKFSRLGLQA